MHVTCNWQDGMKFVGIVDGHQMSMDANKPFGGGSALTPKDLLVVALCGCTGMDINGLMKKHKQLVDEFSLEADVISTEGVHPAVFSRIDMTYRLRGTIDRAILTDAVRLSQTKYCGVSAMLSATVPISYRIELNGEEIGIGEAKFEGLYHEIAKGAQDNE